MFLRLIFGHQMEKAKTRFNELPFADFTLISRYRNTSKRFSKTLNRRLVSTSISLCFCGKVSYLNIIHLTYILPIIN